MATYQTQSTNGDFISVIYPAQRPSSHSANVRFRVGKKTVLPAYTGANLPHLVQFQIDQRIVMFMLNDILETSFWRKTRNAYTFSGELDLEPEVQISALDASRIAQWLRECSASLKIDAQPVECADPAPEMAAG